MATDLSRIFIPIYAPSFDGRYWGRYPHGDKPAVGAELEGHAQDISSASGALSTQIRLLASAQDSAAATAGMSTAIRLAANALSRSNATAKFDGGLLNGDLFSTDLSTGTLGSIFTMAGDFDSESGNGLAIIDDPTSQYGGRSVQFTWVETVPNSGRDNFLLIVQNLPQDGRKHAYVRLRLKLSKEVPPGGIQKIIRFQPRVNGEPTLMGTFNIQWGEFIWQNDGNSPNFQQIPSTMATHGPNTFVNQWRWFEAFVDYSAGNRIIAKAWVDGTLIIDADWAQSLSPTIDVSSWQIMGIYNAPAQNKTDWIDKIDISSVYMGVP